MTMRKKDYEAIARAISKCRDSYAPHWDRNLFRAVDDVSKHIAECCATQDPTFKRERFLADCGVSHD